MWGNGQVKIYRRRRRRPNLSVYTTSSTPIIVDIILPHTSLAEDWQNFPFGQIFVTPSLNRGGASIVSPLRGFTFTLQVDYMFWRVEDFRKDNRFSDFNIVN